MKRSAPPLHADSGTLGGFGGGGAAVRRARADPWLEESSRANGPVGVRPLAIGEESGGPLGPTWCGR